MLREQAFQFFTVRPEFLNLNIIFLKFIPLNSIQSNNNYKFRVFCLSFSVQKSETIKRSSASQFSYSHMHQQASNLFTFHRRSKRWPISHSIELLLFSLIHCLSNDFYSEKTFQKLKIIRSMANFSSPKKTKAQIMKGDQFLLDWARFY